MSELAAVPAGAAGRLISDSIAGLMPAYAPTRLVPARWYDAEQAARTLLSDAERELEAARAKASRIIAEAQLAAAAELDAARQQALDEIETRASETLTLLHRVLNSVVERLAAVTAQQALLWADQVVGESVGGDPEHLIRLVQLGVKRFEGFERVEVLLHPDDRRRLAAFEDRIAAAARPLVVRFGENADLPAGRGIRVIVNPEAGIDVSLDRRMRQLITRVFGADDGQELLARLHGALLGGPVRARDSGAEPRQESES